MFIDLRKGAVDGSLVKIKPALPDRALPSSDDRAHTATTTLEFAVRAERGVRLRPARQASRHARRVAPIRLPFPSGSVHRTRRPWSSPRRLSLASNGVLARSDVKSRLARPDASSRCHRNHGAFQLIMIRRSSSTVSSLPDLCAIYDGAIRAPARVHGHSRLPILISAN